MQEMLVQAGLTESQAAVYLYLLDHGITPPPEVARQTNLTRTNAYKILDTLEELGLVKQEERNKKIVYIAEDPTALATLVASERNRVVALEESVKIAMGALRKKYRTSTQPSTVSRKTGTEAMIDAYEKQAEIKDDIFFVKSRADIPFLGFEMMKRLRHLPAQHGTKRYGITPRALEAKEAEPKDKHTNLTRTYIEPDEYTSPVEWAVSGDELLIVKFDGQGECIKISDPVIADSFRQLYKLLDKQIRLNPDYNEVINEL